jgi:hypothetical protein
MRPFTLDMIKTKLTKQTKKQKTLLEKVQIPTEFRDRIYFVSIRDEIRDRKQQSETKIKIYELVTEFRDGNFGLNKVSSLILSLIYYFYNYD